MSHCLYIFRKYIDMPAYGLTCLSRNLCQNVSFYVVDEISVVGRKFIGRPKYSGRRNFSGRRKFSSIPKFCGRRFPGQTKFQWQTEIHWQTKFQWQAKIQRQTKILWQTEIRYSTLKSQTTGQGQTKVCFTQIQSWKGEERKGKGKLSVPPNNFGCDLLKRFVKIQIPMSFYFLRIFMKKCTVSRL